jgi:hypothetical protein
VTVVSSCVGPSDRKIKKQREGVFVRSSAESEVEKGAVIVVSSCVGPSDRKIKKQREIVFVRSSAKSEVEKGTVIVVSSRVGARKVRKTCTCKNISVKRSREMRSVAMVSSRVGARETRNEKRTECDCGIVVCRVLEKSKTRSRENVYL